MGEGLLSDIPLGFSAAAETLNKLPQDCLAELCSEVLRFLQYKVGTINIVSFQQTLEERQCSVSKEALQSGVNALTFVFRSAAAGQASPDDLLAALQASRIWSDASLAAIKKLWHVQGKLLMEGSAASKILNVGQLLNIDWKLGMAVSSSSCRGLNTPFVTLLLRVAEPSGNIIERSVEMSVPEFQNFAQEMKSMSGMLATA
ncbi:COMM domain-containing protein 6-like [Sycon ciliatum]|uniref:COMM domain-containing protein 6-like n=1 Tax=Sycon ciliatum TaxID=27933 RepID=UPI0020ACC70F|eukprot:scpid94508/ scgid20731/ COMM domain-containing protein 6